MRSTTKVVAAAMAAVMTAASLPAAATNNGLSKKQVLALVKQEVAKIPRIAGPRGPRGAAGPAGATGPAGMDGSTFLSATVGADGVIFEGTSNGITDDNVRRVSTLITPEEGESFIHEMYCFSGLPPVTSGQVTLMGVRLPIITVPYLVVETEETKPPLGCDVSVYIAGENGLEAANFHIQLY